MQAPPPTPDEAKHGARLRALIDRQLACSGILDFSAYMDLALYAPGLGYYSAGKAKLGAAGDFITAPEMGNVFARCLARALAPALQEIGGDILEIGAGSGALARDLLAALAALGVRPGRYVILETSADLRERQRATVLASCTTDTVTWLDTPPDQPWQGVVLANEVIDALPVRLFRRRAGAWYAKQVGRDAQGGWAWVETPADPALLEALQPLQGCAAHWPDPYQSEVRPQLGAWLAAITHALQRGLVLLVDYGYPRAAYYAPDRDQGTLRCYYRHRVHDDPLVLPGLQDITASVDFTALAEAAQACGFDVACYAPQGAFLVAHGITEVAQEGQPGSHAGQAPQDVVNQVRRLVLPSDMGERFQVLALHRELPESTLTTLRSVDRSDRLWR